MRSPIRPSPSPSLRGPLIKSAAAHAALLIVFLAAGHFSWSFRQPKLNVTWVDIPKGTSDEIELGMNKSDNLPRSTIQDQKMPILPDQKPLTPDYKRPSGKEAEFEQTKKPDSMKEPEKKQASKAKKEEAPPQKAKISATDRRIQQALAKINKNLDVRTAPAEAAQVKESGQGFRYGTGTTPLRVMPDDPEYIRYQAMVRGKIINEWVVPPVVSDEMRAPQLRAMLIVMINNVGEVTSVEWHTRSGDAAFDASAMRAIRRAAPLPVPPDRLAWEAYNEGFLVEFDPRLKP